MGFPSLLERNLELFDEREHLHERWSGYSVRAANRPAATRSQHAREDAEQAERDAREYIKHIQRFVDFYRQDSQQLSQARGGLGRHASLIERIVSVLEPLPASRSWGDEARWSFAQAVQSELNRLIREGGLNAALSPTLLHNLKSSADSILKKGRNLRHRLGAAVRNFSEAPLSEATRGEIRRWADFLRAVLPQWESDCDQLAAAVGELDKLHGLWAELNKQITELPLRLQRRLTVKELSRLNLHEEQERYVSLDHRGCYQLGGVSGSGKSLILVNRALRLAREQPARSVLVLTINRSLAVQLRGTLETFNGGRLPDNLEVSSVYDLFQKCVSTCSPTQLVRLYDERSKERVHESWRDFVSHRGRDASQNVFADAAVQSLLKLLSEPTRTGSPPAAMAYLFDEVQCVQSAYLRRDRGLYFDEERLGRVYALKRRRKDAVLKVVDAWEEWLRVGGLCDVQTISLLAADPAPPRAARSPASRLCGCEGRRESTGAAARHRPASGLAASKRVPCRPQRGVRRCTRPASGEVRGGGSSVTPRGRG